MILELNFTETGLFFTLKREKKIVHWFHKYKLKSPEIPSLMFMILLLKFKINYKTIEFSSRHQSSWNFVKFQANQLEERRKRANSSISMKTALYYILHLDKFFVLGQLLSDVTHFSLWNYYKGQKLSYFSPEKLSQQKIDFFPHKFPKNLIFPKAEREQQCPRLVVVIFCLFISI